MSKEAVEAGPCHKEEDGQACQQHHLDGGERIWKTKFVRGHISGLVLRISSGEIVTVSGFLCNQEVRRKSQM